MDTEELIRTLTNRMEPVRPLRRPWRRAALWTTLAVAYLAVLVVTMSPREDLARRMAEARFLVEQAAALLTGLSAAGVALATVVPGFSRRVLLVPLTPLAVWLGVVGAGALAEYSASGAGVLTWQFDWACIGTILTGAAVPGIAMGVMLRRGAAVAPHLSAAYGALAAAGLGNLGVCLFHPHSSYLILLVWHCGTVLVIAALAGATGARLLRWPPDSRAALAR